MFKKAPTIMVFILGFSLSVYAQGSVPFLAEATRDNINIRAGQSSNFESIGRLMQGDQVVVVEKSYSWYKIRLPLEARCFISDRYIKDLGQNIAEVMVKNLNIRSGPAIRSSVLGQAEQGQLVRIINRVVDADGEGWAQIEPIEQSYGWIQEDLLAFKSREIPPPREIGPPIRNIYVLKKIQEEQRAEAEAAARLEMERKLDEERKLLRMEVGIVREFSGPGVFEDIRHHLIVEGQERYLLKGYRSIIDWFINQKVRVEGKLQPGSGAGLPVLLVTRIQLVL